MSSKRRVPRKSGTPTRRSVAKLKPQFATPKPAKRALTAYQKNMRTLRDIAKLQKSVDLLIPNAPFNRLVRQISNQKNVNYSGTEFRFQASAIEALHVAAEDYLNDVMQDAYMNTIHAKRVTLMDSDIERTKATLTRMTPMTFGSRYLEDQNDFGTLRRNQLYLQAQEAKKKAKRKPAKKAQALPPKKRKRAAHIVEVEKLPPLDELPSLENNEEDEDNEEEDVEEETPAEEDVNDEETMNDEDEQQEEDDEEDVEVPVEGSLMVNDEDENDEDEE